MSFQRNSKFIVRSHYTQVIGVHFMVFAWDLVFPLLLFLSIAESRQHSSLSNTNKHFIHTFVSFTTKTSSVHEPYHSFDWIQLLSCLNLIWTMNYVNLRTERNLKSTLKKFCWTVIENFTLYFYFLYFNFIPLNNNSNQTSEKVENKKTSCDFLSSFLFSCCLVWFCCLTT